MSKVTIFAVFGAAILLVATVATSIVVRTTPAEMPVSVPAPIDVVDKIIPAPAAVAAPAVAARSLYVSEKTLRARLDEAYERGTPEQVQALLRILNGRYEHRCCGLPR